MVLIHPVTLLIVGTALALSPVFYLWTDNTTALMWGLRSFSEDLVGLWALAGAMMCLGLSIPLPYRELRLRALNQDRLYGVFITYSILQIVFIGVIYRFLGYLPITRVSEGFNISAMNDDLGKAGGFFGLFVILQLPYLGLAAHVLTVRTQGIAAFFGKLLAGMFAVFLSLAMAKMQPLAVLIIATMVFWIFRMREERGITVRVRHCVVLAGLVVAFLELGGWINVFRSGNPYTILDGTVGGDWLVRYTLFPFMNISSILDQTGFVWIQDKCYFLAYILPAALRQNYCREALDFSLPVITSPSGFLSPPYTSWGAGGLAAFSLLCGFAVKLAFRKAANSLSARFTYALMAWALLMVGTYNHFLNAYFLYYPAILFFVMMKFIEEWQPSLGAVDPVEANSNS